MSWNADGEMKRARGTSAAAYLVLAALLILPIIAWVGISAVWSVQFDRGCGGHLKRAADANVVDLAQEELGKALTYMEREGLTNGYTSVLWTTPDEDVGFWYRNLKAANGELAAVPTDATRLERSNVLMKLRETILDGGRNGAHVTVPEGISRYPYNRLMTAFLVLSLAALVAAFLSLKAWDDNY